MSKKHKGGKLIQLLICIVLAIVLFCGGRYWAAQPATFSWEGFIASLPRFSLAEIPALRSLPVISRLFPAEEETEALQIMQRSEDENGEVVLDGEAINILMMGIDARDPAENTRSDTMILLSVDTKEKQAALISIPRDTLITTRRGVTQKINEVNATAGAEAACTVVEDLLHTEVDHYVILNFNSFTNIVDILGGVDLEVEMDMFHADDIDPELQIDLKKGQQHLDGRDALQYVRYRGGAMADIGRTQRQLKFLKAMSEKVFSINGIRKIPDLWLEVSNSIRTDLSLADIGSLVKVAAAFKDTELYSQTVPGTPNMIGGVSYWLATKSVLPNLVSNVRKGKTIDIGEDKELTLSNPLEISPSDAAEEIFANSGEEVRRKEESTVDNLDSIMPEHFWIEESV